MQMVQTMPIQIRHQMSNYRDYNLDEQRTNGYCLVRAITMFILETNLKNSFFKQKQKLKRQEEEYIIVKRLLGISIMSYCMMIPNIYRNPCHSSYIQLEKYIIPYGILLFTIDDYMTPVDINPYGRQILEQQLVGNNNTLLVN